MNALVGTAEQNSTVAKVGEYMRAGDDDRDIRVIVLTGVRRGFCSGANLGSRASAAVSNRIIGGAGLGLRGIPQRKLGSHRTRCWREPDSNHRSRLQKGAEHRLEFDRGDPSASVSVRPIPASLQEKLRI
jgi:enoyl-CoA hydratase/carnithine racemase